MDSCALRGRLPRCDGDFDSGIQAEIIAIKSMMFSVLVPNIPPNFTEKIDVALFSQVPRSRIRSARACSSTVPQRT